MRIGVFWAVLVILGLVMLRDSDPSDRVSTSGNHPTGTTGRQISSPRPVDVAVSYNDDKETEDDAGGNFRGYPCTVDCSGHEAGYRWADEHGIDDPDDCDGNSESFIEGCKAYAREQQGETESEDQ